MASDCEELNPSMKEAKRDPLLLELERSLQRLEQSNLRSLKQLQFVKEESKRKTKAAFIVGIIAGFQIGLLIGFLLG